MTFSKTEKSILTIYLAAAVANVYFATTGIKTATVLSKALLMPLLMAFVYLQPHFSLKKPLLIALLFSFLGDMLLTNSHWFLFGLGAFLVTQLIYYYIFKRGSTQLISRVLFFTFWLAMVMVLKPKLDSSLLLPVVLYACVITLMGIRASERPAGTSYKWVLSGALLFIFSDTCIAFDRFLVPLPARDFLVMSTYVAAQLLIVLGLTKAK